MALTEKQRQYQRLGVDAVRDIDIPENASEEAVINLLQQGTRAAVLAVTTDPEAVYFVRRGFLIGVLKRYEKKMAKGTPAPEFREMILKLLRRLHKVYQAEVAERSAPATATSTRAPTTPRRRSVQKKPTSIPEWRPAPQQPVDPESYLKKLLQSHPEQTYYGQLVRSLFIVRGVDTKNPFPAPQKPAPIVSAEPPRETPKSTTPDASKSQGEKKKAA